MVSRYLLVLVLTVVFAREGLGAVTDAVGDFKLQHQNQVSVYTYIYICHIQV